MPGVDGNQITFSTGTLTQKTLPTADSLKLDYDEDVDNEDVKDEDVNDEDVNDEDANDENDTVSLKTLPTADTMSKTSSCLPRYLSKVRLIFIV